MEKQTLGEIASQKLLEMIQRDGYTAGDKLPTEAELVELLGVGRNTVREALRILMSRNIVTIRQGSGTFISDKNGVSDDPLGFAMIEDRRKLTEDLIQVRVMLEPPIANCSHNLVMTNLVPVITDGVRVFAGAVQETEYEQTLKSHRRIFEAIRDRKPVEAQQAMYFHLMYNHNRYKGEMRDGKQGMKGTRAKEQ